MITTYIPLSLIAGHSQGRTQVSGPECLGEKKPETFGTATYQTNEKSPRHLLKDPYGPHLIKHINLNKAIFYQIFVLITELSFDGAHGARPTNDISIEFEIRSKFRVL